MKKKEVLQGLRTQGADLLERQFLLHSMSSTHDWRPILLALLIRSNLELFPSLSERKFGM